MSSDQSNAFADSEMMDSISSFAYPLARLSVAGLSMWFSAAGSKWVTRFLSRTDTLLYLKTTATRMEMIIIHFGCHFFFLGVGTLHVLLPRKSIHRKIMMPNWILIIFIFFCHFFSLSLETFSPLSGTHATSREFWVESFPDSWSMPFSNPSSSPSVWI